MKTYTKTMLDPTSTTCVVFDMDDTLCRHAKHGGYNDLSDLEPIAPVLDLARMLLDHGHDILIATARPDDSRAETQAWLNKYLPKARGLYMRSSVTTATASASKGHMVTDIEKLWDIAFVVDDSPYNCRVFTDLGLTAIRPMTNEEYWQTVGDS